jgi:hypothetical protein
MNQIIYEFEPHYSIYKEYQKLEKETKEKADNNLVDKIHKLYKILLREAPYYLDECFLS